MCCLFGRRRRDRDNVAGVSDTRRFDCYPRESRIPVAVSPVSDFRDNRRGCCRNRRDF